jgi:hypothetical protein
VAEQIDLLGATTAPYEVGELRRLLGV